MSNGRITFQSVSRIEIFPPCHSVLFIGSRIKTSVNNVILLQSIQYELTINGSKTQTGQSIKVQVLVLSPLDKAKKTSLKGSRGRESKTKENKKLSLGNRKLDVGNKTLLLLKSYFHHKNLMKILYNLISVGKSKRLFRPFFVVKPKLLKP